MISRGILPLPLGCGKPSDDSKSTFIAKEKFLNISREKEGCHQERKKCIFRVYLNPQKVISA